MRSIPQILIVFICSSFASRGQVIKGAVEFQNDRVHYDYTYIHFGGIKTTCDSLGHFTVTRYSVEPVIDTLLISPMPGYIKVKIFNISTSIDTVILLGIPLFAEINRGIPMIHFKTKRASNKYFKQLERTWKEEELDLEKRIESSRFWWNGREYTLRLVKDNFSSTILIDLKS